MVELEGWFHRYNKWSFSKHRLWNECRRQYWYRYIGTAMRTSDDVDVARLKAMRGLTPRAALEGMLVHDAIEKQMDQFANGTSVSEDMAAKHLVSEMTKFTGAPGQKIIEFHNGVEQPDDYFERVQDGGIGKLGTFFAKIWPRIEGSEHLRHEKFDEVTVGDVVATVKVDLACRTADGTIVVYDWKTGRENPAYESELQLGAYVLWASRYYGTAPVKVRSELAYLATGNVRRHEFSDKQLDRVGRLIVSDFKRMNRSYEMGAFPPDPGLWKCQGCRFATVCPSSRHVEALGQGHEPARRHE